MPPQNQNKVTDIAEIRPEIVVSQIKDRPSQQSKANTDVTLLQTFKPPTYFQPRRRRKQKNRRANQQPAANSTTYLTATTTVQQHDYSRLRGPDNTTVDRPRLISAASFSTLPRRSPQCAIIAIAPGDLHL